jgi:hypothetical protein
MEQPAYLLIVYYAEHDYDTEHAQRQYVKKRTWEIIQEDMFNEISIHEIPYVVERKRSFQMGDFTGQTMITVLDVKLKNSNSDAKSNA